MVQYIDYHTIYTVGKRWFISSNVSASLVTFFYDAPFGRFATPDSILALDGIKSWILMELVSPVSFLATLAIHPFSRTPFPVPFVNSSEITPQALLSGLYLIHYFNRALISPLRTPSRSTSHPAVVLSGIVFNAFNGFMLASYLSSRSTAAFLEGSFSSSRFWLGVALWAIGLVSNVAHDEILLDIRRKAKAKGKGRSDGAKKPGEHYAIPQGLLYSYISYPNYFSEWIEWLGYSMAAAPLPNASALPALAALVSAVRAGALGTFASLWVPFVDTISPPWAFLLAELATMTPRAVRGHHWYRRRFGDAYPRERRVVIPFIL